VAFSSEIHATAIEVAILMVCLIILILLLLWLGVICLDFAIRYMRDRHEKENGGGICQSVCEDEETRLFGRYRNLRGNGSHIHGIRNESQMMEMAEEAELDKRFMEAKLLELRDRGTRSGTERAQALKSSGRKEEGADQGIPRRRSAE
jgi:hypothetical protein